MNEDRRKILGMLADGRITADEAERLIAALDKHPAASGGSSLPAATGSAPAKYLRVIVDALDDDKPSKVNIRVPLQLLRAGVNLQGLLPVEARAQINAALSEFGIDFDLGQIKRENVDELIEAFRDMTVDIDADGGRAKVRIFCE